MKCWHLQNATNAFRLSKLLFQPTLAQWEFIMCLVKSLLNMNVISHIVNFSSTWFWIVLNHVSLQFWSYWCNKITETAMQIFSELSWWKESYVTFTSFHNFCLHSVSVWDVLFQITFTFQCFITEVALDFTTFVSHVNFQITRCAHVLKTVGQFSHLIAFLTPIHFVMWLLLLLCGFFLTVFAGKFPVRIHVCQ